MLPLWRLGKLRNDGIKACPLRRFGCPYIELWPKRGSVIQGGKPDRGEIRIRFAFGEQRGTAGSAETPDRCLTATATYRVCTRRAICLQVCGPNYDSRCERCSTCHLAIFAMAIEPCDRLADARIADRPAGATARNWSEHGETSKFDA